MLAFIFASTLKWLPVQGFTPLSDGLQPWLRSLILPAVTLSLVYSAIIARVTRASMLEVLSEDYIRTARAKGVAPWRILFRHALQNAAVPVVTIIGIGIATLIGSAVITENVFAIPGVGRLTVDAILHRDYPIIQGVVLMLSARLRAGQCRRRPLLHAARSEDPLLSAEAVSQPYVRRPSTLGEVLRRRSAGRDRRHAAPDPGGDRAPRPAGSPTPIRRKLNPGAACGRPRRSTGSAPTSSAATCSRG